MNFEDYILTAGKVGGAIASIVVVFKYIRDFTIFIRELSKLPETIKNIEKELKTNGGNSLKDKVLKIEKNQIRRDQIFEILLNSNSDIGFYETDKDGMCTKVSLSYCKIIGKSQEECLGKGWVSAIHPEDRESVFKEWSDAVKYERPFFIKKYRFVNGESIVYVEGSSHPIFDDDRKIIAWYGNVTVIK